MGKIFYDDVLGLLNLQVSFWGILQIPDILWGNLSGQAFLGWGGGVQSRCLGLAYVAIESQSTPPRSLPYPTLPWNLSIILDDIKS